MLSCCNEIVKQLVWNSLMKGLVLKVKLIYFTSAWSQELLLCNFLGMRLRRTVEWLLSSALSLLPANQPPFQHGHSVTNQKQMKTAASSTIHRSAGCTQSSWGKQLARMGPPGADSQGGGGGGRGGAGTEDGCRAVVIKPARLRPSRCFHKSAIEEAPRGRNKLSYWWII